MNMIVTTPEAQKGFYPTPPALAAKLVEGLDINHSMTILEPSAGSGNLIFALAPSMRTAYYSSRFYSMKWDIDCIEIDSALRGVLKENFSDDAEKQCKASAKAILQAEGCTEYGDHSKMSDDSRVVYEHLKDLEFLHEKAKVRVIHDNFLTFRPEKSYDLILMNPPFADGDKHLLKAIHMQRKTGGQIRCLLNAETIRNPFTNSRKLLAQWLQENEAQIEFIEGAFRDAERETEVEVALIKLTLPKPELFSNIWEHCEKAEACAEPTPEDPTDLVIPDIIKQFVARYRVEINAGTKLIQEYIALKPYILTSATKSEYNKPLLQMGVGTASACDRPSVNEYVRCVRRKYWELLFKRKEFVGQLTTNLQEMLNGRVNEMVEYEFSEFNIRQIMLEMQCAMSQGVIDTILEKFDDMTVKYSHNDEFGTNIHYYNGWKTNQCWRVNPKKVILPGWVFPDYSWSKDTFNTYKAYGYLSDIEKALNYLDGHATAEARLDWQLNAANQCGKTKNIRCKYFSVTFYKKGTIHISWLPEARDLIDRLNIFCSQHRNWLPPRYGKAAYANMDTDEKAVVDSFHGDGSEGSGEKAYADVMARASYFLAPPNNDTPMLGCGSEEE